MAEIKVYISLKEAEGLVFKRFLLLDKERFNVKKAQGLYSILLLVEKGMRLDFESKYLILFSAVNYFDIPENEKTLFTNHYKVPLGLIKLSNRLVKDDLSGQYTISDNNYSFTNYIQIRNGLLGVFHLSYSKASQEKFKNKSIKVLNEFNSLSEIRRKLLQELLTDFKFPVLAVKTNRLVTDTLFRVVWWGKFIVDSYLPSLNINNEESKAIKTWIKNFFNFDKINLINKNLATVPEGLGMDIDFLLGYYFASCYSEFFNEDSDFLDKLFNDIEYNNKEELFCWISFFTSMMNQNVSSIYFVKSLRNDILNIENIAIELSQNNFELPIEKDYEFSLRNINKEELILEYVQLKYGGNKKAVKLISSQEAKNVFTNNLFKSGLQKVGFEITSKYDNSKLIKNTCYLTDKQLHLNINTSIDASDITFYLEQDSVLGDKLKQLRLKTKSIDKLIDVKKKVLIGFNILKNTPLMCNVYSSNFRFQISSKFEKVIFVLLVDLDAEKIQSSDFDNFVKEEKLNLQRLFDVEVELIIKNKQTISDVEIKRNLKNILKDYRVNQMEVIDENFDNEKANWLLEGNTEYLIDDKDNSYYCLML